MSSPLLVPLTSLRFVARKIALQAMLADPVVTSMDAAERCLDELLSVHAAYLPQFS